MVIEMKWVIIKLKLNAKEVVKITQMLQVESNMQITNELLNKFLIAINDNDVTYIH